MSIFTWRDRNTTHMAEADEVEFTAHHVVFRDEDGRVAHAAHESHVFDLVEEIPAPLKDVPAGPFTQHLEAMTHLVSTLVSRLEGEVDMSPLEETWQYHVQEIARHTAADPMGSIITRPPAANETIWDANSTGTGWLRVDREEDGERLTWTRVDPATVIVKDAP